MKFNSPLRSIVGLNSVIILLIIISTMSAIALAPKVQRLYEYCHNNHAVSLVDGSDAEIICRNGDPNNVLGDNRISELWDALSRSQQQSVVETDHCEELYADMGNTIVENCRELVDPHTGIVKDPVDNGPPDAPRATPSTNPGDQEDIFGVSRDDLRDCTGPDCLDINPVTKMVIRLINILSATIGILVTVMIIIGGIEYSSAGGDPQKVAMAKKRITNALIALVSLFFLFVVINYLVPGGIFR